MFFQRKKATEQTGPAPLTTVAATLTITSQDIHPEKLRPVDLCCTYFTQQYIGSHIIENASDTILA